MLTFKKINIFLITVVVGVLASCNHLDTELSNQFDRQDYYIDATQTYTVLSGVYGSMRPMYQTTMSNWLSSGTDEMVYNKSYTNRAGSEISQFSYSPFDLELSDFWRDSYFSINLANDLIYNLESRDSISGLLMLNKNSMIGEGLVIRAFNYFNLVRMFEDIPLKLLPLNDVVNELEPLRPGKTPAADVYDQIIEDLEHAIPMLLNTPVEYGRISKPAAQGILARVYLHLAGKRLQGGNIGQDVCYQKAIYNCDEVINQGKHFLLPDYTDVFLNEIQQIRNNSEIMWEIDFVKNEIRDNGSQVGTYSGPKVAGPDANSPTTIAWNYSAATLKDTYDINENDIRSDWNVATYSISYSNILKEYKSNEVDNELNYYPGKWKRVNRTIIPNDDGTDVTIIDLLETGYVDKYRTSFNYPIIRYADVLLMKAEAENEISGPNGNVFDLINQVRTRAGIRTVQEELSESGNGISKESVLVAIQDERMRELCFEGNRRFDLVRWGILQQNVHALSQRITDSPDFDSALSIDHIPIALDRAEAKHDVFPIPDDELVVNPNMAQHPEW